MDSIKEYHAYFCHASADFNWTMNLINLLESGIYMFKCAEYQRDYIGAKYVMDLFESFMDSSNFIVVILSPSFLECKWSMYQLLLAVEFSLEKNLWNIIPVVYKECQVPLCMQVFDPLHVSTKGWSLRLIERLGRPAKRLPKDNGICTRDGRISIDALRPITNRDVKSEPLIGQESTTPLTSHQYNKVECFHRIRLETLERSYGGIKTKNPEGNLNSSLKLLKHCQLCGEKAKDKRTSNPRQRVSADDIMDADKTIDEEMKIGGKEENRIKMKTSIQHDENEEMGNLTEKNRQNPNSNKRHDIKTSCDDKKRPEFNNSKSTTKKPIYDVVINCLQRKDKGLLPNKATKGKTRKQRPDCKHMPTSEESSNHHKGQQTTDEIRQERHSDEGSSIPYPRYSNEGSNIPYLRYSDEVSGIRHESYSDENSCIPNSRYSSEDTGNSHPRHSERSLDIRYNTEDDYGDETVKDSLFGGDNRLQRQRTQEDKGTDILPNRKRTSSGDYEDTQSAPNEEELSKLKYTLLDTPLVFEGEWAQYKRRRSGNKERINADILLDNEV